MRLQYHWLLRVQILGVKPMNRTNTVWPSEIQITFPTLKRYDIIVIIA